MLFAGARWTLSQRLRRFGVRWRASRMAAGEPWSLPDPRAEIAGFRPDQQHEALSAACRLLDVEECGEPRRYGRQRKSVGTTVRARDGSANWLKVVCLHSRAAIWMRDGELSAPEIPNVSRPSIIRTIDWNADGISWCALQFTLAPSLPAAETAALTRPIATVDDNWLAGLKRALDRVGEMPLTRWHAHPGTIARVVARRFGRRAPIDIDEWRNAHGDINWGNVTMPSLALLDWEYWGAAPRGFDAATLLVHSIIDSAMTRRITALFADDLETPTGRVAQLYLMARHLDQIEAGFGDPRHHGPLEAEARRLLKR